MLTYRGDKFVRGKTYKLDESLTFIKREEDNLVFESVDNKTIIMTEAEFESKLLEKINQENKDINEIIGKVLRSKGLARKYEDLLKSKGISIDYSSPQGVTLTGPNGRVLGASSKEVYGPHTPDSSGDRYDKNGYRRKEDSHYKTDDKPDTYYSEYRDEEINNLEKLNAMDRDDIIRAYPDKTTEEALQAHKDLINRTKKRIEDYSKGVEQADKRYKRSLKAAKETRRNAEYDRLRTATPREKADSTMDYLNYLTKPKNEYMDDIRSYYKGYGERSKSNPAAGFENRNKESDLDKYRSLKSRVSDAKQDVNWYTFKNDFSSSRAAMTDEELENKIQSMRDKLEKEIEELRKSNKANTETRNSKVKELEKREKELDDFLKSKGIRESELLEVKSYLKEELDYRESYKDIYDEEADYTQMRKMIDALQAIYEQSIEDGYNFTSEFEKALNALSNVYESLEEFYEHTN